MTKAQIETLVNGFLQSNQPITAAGHHKPSMQVLIDELYNAQSRGDVLKDIADAVSLAGGDKVFIVRASGVVKVPTSLFVNAQWRGAANISGGLYPTNGSGSGGAVVAGDTWNVTVEGNLDLGTGAEPVPVKSLLVALTNAPAQTPANWRVV